MRCRAVFVHFLEEMKRALGGGHWRFIIFWITLNTRKCRTERRRYRCLTKGRGPEQVNEAEITRNNDDHELVCKIILSKTEIAQES